VVRASSQRRRLALLALIAGSGSGGISRDKVLAYLWPSRDNEHARHSLAQLIYSMRSSFGCNLIEGDAEFRVDRSTLSSDVADFIEASGDQLRMSELYAGPFLDGFHLNDSIEFSHWVDRVRERTTAMACAALEGLASAASLRGDHTSSIAIWRARVALDPLDAGPATALMEALAASGDRAGSIRHAQAYQKLIRDELDMEADPQVGALADRVRRQAPGSESKVGTRPAGAAVEALAKQPVDAATQEMRDEFSEPAKLARRRKSRRVSKVVAALAIGAIGVAGALWGRGRAGRRGD
jgi:DNA-binding SARP family transcriptional activator